MVFEWSEVASNCPIFHYHITSSNCGQCPNTTRNTTATCTGNFTTNSLSLCSESLAVQSVLCGDIHGDTRMIFEPDFGENMTEGTVYDVINVEYQIMAKEFLPSIHGSCSKITWQSNYYLNFGPNYCRTRRSEKGY